MEDDGFYKIRRNLIAVNLVIILISLPCVQFGSDHSIELLGIKLLVTHWSFLVGLFFVWLYTLWRYFGASQELKLADDRTVKHLDRRMQIDMKIIARALANNKLFKDNINKTPLIDSQVVDIKFINGQYQAEVEYRLFEIDDMSGQLPLLNKMTVKIPDNLRTGFQIKWKFMSFFYTNYYSDHWFPSFLSIVTILVVVIRASIDLAHKII